MITELNRKPSSCPFLYSWNGTSFEFVTDFLGGGEMGYWTGAHGWSVPDGDEYVRLSERQLVSRNGRLELRVTNELEEVLYLDHLQLLSIDHPPDVEVFPREGMRAVPQNGLSLVAVRNVRPLARVVTDRGEDVTSRVAQSRRRRRGRLRANRHSRICQRSRADLRVQERRRPGVLAGVVAHGMDRLRVLERQRRRGSARLVARSAASRGARAGRRVAPLVADVGIPVGRPQTIVVDIGAAASVAGTQFRLTTNMQIQWDVMAIADLASDVALEPRTHAVETATLAWRGYSAVAPEASTPWRAPDYTRVSPASPWKVFPGRYTREGDVRAPVSGARRSLCGRENG